jgi:hypothetical protein
VTTITKASVNKKSTWLVKYYLFLWLGLGILLSCLHLLGRPDYIKTPTSLFSGFANLFGPWATIIVKASDFPNAGGSFNLKHALIYTTILIPVIIIPLLIKKRWFQILCAVLYAPLIICWLRYGWRQLVACAI